MSAASRMALRLLAERRPNVSEATRILADTDANPAALALLRAGLVDEAKCVLEAMTR